MPSNTIRPNHASNFATPNDVNGGGETIIDITARTSPPRRPRPQALDLTSPLTNSTARFRTPVYSASGSPRRCSASLKIALLSSVAALGSGALLAHSIARTVDSGAPSSSTSDCQGAVECGGRDGGDLAIEYVGAAVLGLTAMFGAGAAWMCRMHDRG